MPVMAHDSSQCAACTSVPAQCPAFGGQAAAIGEGFGVATGVDVACDERPGACRVGGPAKSGPSGQVQQAGAAQRHREVERPPPGRSEVDGAGM